MKNTAKFLSALLITLTLAACGGSDEAVVMAVPTNTVLAASPTTTAAVKSTPFTFPQGVTDLGTTASTSVTFTDTATTPAFTIASGTYTASGTTKFGSCIFVVSASTFPAGSRLAAGNTITVNPCNINVNSAGLQATGVASTRSVALALGAAVSAGSSLTVQVNPGGQLTLNGISVGSVTLVPVTGTTGGQG